MTLNNIIMIEMESNNTLVLLQNSDSQKKSKFKRKETKIKKIVQKRLAGISTSISNNISAETIHTQNDRTYVFLV